MIARERILVPLVCVLVGWFYVWTARSSSDPWDFGAEQTDYYNLLIDGWLDGQLNLKVDVPEALLQASDPYNPATRPPGGLHDASFYHGKYYLYFGAAPVVTLMLPFRVLTGHDLPMPAAILVFALGGFGISTLLWLRVRRDYFPNASSGLVLLGAGILGAASMALVIVRRGNVWELPLSSGYFFAMAGLGAIYCSAHSPTRGQRWLALASLALGLAVASRPTYLFATPALLMPVLATWRGVTWRERFRWLLAAALPVALIGMALAAHNYARFGNPLEFGTAYMLGGADEAKAKYFSPAYFGYNVVRYFLLPAEWLRYFPFLYERTGPAMPSGYYGVEEVFGVSSGFLVLWCVPFAPLALRYAERGRLRAWLAATVLLALGPTVMLCCFWAAMARYQIDFMPALLLLGGVGLLALERWADARPRFLRAALRSALTGVLLVSIGFGVLQSLALYGNLRRLNPRAYARIAAVFNVPSYLAEKIAGTPHGPLEMEITLPALPAGTRLPLVSTGLPKNQDRLLLVRQGDDIQFICAHEGGAEKVSPLVPWETGRSRQLRIELGSLYPPEAHPYFSGSTPSQRVARTRWWRIVVDGKPVFESYQRFHPAAPATLRIGAEIEPRAGEAKFSGQIRDLHIASPTATESSGATARDFNAVRLRLTFPREKVGMREPLVSAGDIGHGDFVFVEYVDEGHVRFGFDHWGKPTRFSEPCAVSSGHPCELEISLGSFGRDSAVQRQAVAPVQIVVDGRVVWEFLTKLYPIEPEDVFVGHNPIGGTSSEATFSGVIHSTDWILRPRTPSK